MIISHFHGDHINGLLGADNKFAFPNAELLVPAAEWTFWMDEANAGRFPEPIKGQFGNVKRVFGALGDKPAQYAAGKEVAPGITAMATPGHTPGHTSFVVASGSDKVLLQVDVTAAAVSLFLNHPEWKLAFDTDGPLAEQTRHKVYDMAIADNMLIQGYHFHSQAAVMWRRRARAIGSCRRRGVRRSDDLLREQRRGPLPWRPAPDLSLQVRFAGRCRRAI